MKTINLSIFLLIFISTGCSSVQIFSDFDRTADFSKYKTYAWLPKSDSIQDLFHDNPIMEKNLKFYVNNEMTARGYKVDINYPDLLIEYHTMIERKQQIVNNPVYSNPANTYYGPYPYNRYNRPYPYGFNNTPYITGYTTQVIDYNEGTLVIDVIDRKQNQHIWRGWSVGTVSDMNNLETVIEKDIKRIFKKYPLSVPQRK
jgi:hypothetical protein